MLRKTLLRKLQDHGCHVVELIQEGDAVYCYGTGDSNLANEMIHWWRDELRARFEPNHLDRWLVWYVETDTMRFNGVDITVAELLKEGEIA